MLKDHLARNCQRMKRSLPTAMERLKSLAFKIFLNFILLFKDGEVDINAESLEFDIASLLGRIVSYIFVWN